MQLRDCEDLVKASMQLDQQLKNPSLLSTDYFLNKLDLNYQQIGVRLSEQSSTVGEKVRLLQESVLSFVRESQKEKQKFLKGFESQKNSQIRKKLKELVNMKEYFLKYPSQVDNTKIQQLARPSQDFQSQVVSSSSDIVRKVDKILNQLKRTGQTIGKPASHQISVQWKIQGIVCAAIDKQCQQIYVGGQQLFIRKSLKEEKFQVINSMNVGKLNMMSLGLIKRTLQERDICVSAIAVNDQHVVHFLDSRGAGLYHVNKKDKLISLLAFGKVGSGVMQLSRPNGLVISKGVFYIADSGNNRVVSWQQSTNTFTLIIEKLSFPTGLSFNDKYLVICNRDQNQLILMEGGSVKESFKKIGNQELNSPSAICFYQNNFWLTDTRSHRVIRFNSNLTIVKARGQMGSQLHQLNRPVGLFGWEGCIYVVDKGNNRLIRMPCE